MQQHQRCHHGCHRARTVSRVRDSSPVQAFCDVPCTSDRTPKQDRGRRSRCSGCLLSQFRRPIILRSSCSPPLMCRPAGLGDGGRQVLRDCLCWAPCSDHPRMTETKKGLWDWSPRHHPSALSSCPAPLQ